MKQTSSPSKNSMPTPILVALVMSISSALVVGYSFVVIKYWPQPASVVPALSFGEGVLWGAVVGALCGLVLGFLTDDKHFVQ